MNRYPLLALASLFLTAASIRAETVVPSLDTLESATPDAPPAVVLLSEDTVTLTPRETRNVGLAQGWADQAEDLAIVGDGGAVVVRYGASIPTLVCAPLRICDIALEPGEVVNGVDSGDTVRWALTPTVSGSGATAQTHVIVKPLDVGLTTNILISTDRRTYRLKLVSTASQFMSSISFSYPLTASAQWSEYREQAARRHDSAAVVAAPGATAALDFGFRITGDKPAWTPTRVYTDGAQTVVEFPASVASTDMPALVVLDAGGGSQLVNYRVNGSRIIIDRVVDHAMLVLGTGRKQVRVTIRRTGEPA